MQRCRVKCLMVLAAALGGAAAAFFMAGCGKVREAKDRAQAEREREEEVAAVRPEAMSLEVVGKERRFWNTEAFAGKPWLLLAFRAGDPVCREAVADWNGLAEGGQGGVAAVLTDVEAGAESMVGEAALEVAAAAKFPVCGASRTQLDALRERAPMEVNPMAYLFDGEGRLVRVTEGFARVEHHAEDMAALAAGRELPEHPAQGVLPEENDP